MRRPADVSRARVGTIAVLLLVLGAPRARAQAVPVGLTVAEVLELHRGGVSDQRIVRAASTYCIAFVVNDSIARELAAGGIAPALVDSLRGACAATPPRPPLAPGVLIDDDIAATSGIGSFVASDGLCRASLERSQMRIANERRDGGCLIGYPADSLDGPLRIELTVGELVGGKDAQAVLGFGRSTGTWDEYTFSVSASGRTELCRSSAVDCRTLTSRTVKGLVHAGSAAENVLAVELHDGSIALFVNDERVGDYLPDVAVRGGLVIGVGPESSVAFRHLRVRTLEATAAR